MKFTAYKHIIVKKKASKTVKLFWIGIAIFALAFLLYFIDIKTTPISVLSKITNSLFILGAIPLFISYIYQYFDFEVMEITDKGILELNADEIIIDYNQKIKYEEIKEIKFNLVGHYDERINIVYNSPTETRSLGLSNEFQLTTKKQNIKVNFKLENKNHVNNLEEFIFDLVISEKLSNLSAKTKIKLIPERFKKSDGYKNYVIKQLLEKRINCTEGLLFHGYTSDSEAKLLREKYC